MANLSLIKNGLHTGDTIVEQNFTNIDSNFDTIQTQINTNTNDISTINSGLLQSTKQNLVDRPSMIPNTLAKLESGENTLIIVAGDSITHGVKLSLTYTQCYTYKFAQKLATKYANSTVVCVIGDTTDNTEDRAIDTWTPYTIQTGTNGQTITVVRSGVGGDTLLRMFRRMNDIIQYNNVNADLIVVMEGINDSAYTVAKKYVPPTRYENGYRTFVQYLKREVGCEIVIQTSHWHGSSPTSQNWYLDDYVAVQKKVAVQEKVQLIDQNAVWKAHYIEGNGAYGQGGWLDITDQTHPLEAGHQAIADKLYNDLFVENQLIIPLNYEKLQLVKYTSPKIIYGNGWTDKTINSNSNTSYNVKWCTSGVNGTLSCTLKGKKIYLLTRVGLALIGCTVQVDSLTSQTVHTNTTYPTDYSDVTDGAVCSYFYERILIADGLSDTEHTISITNANMFGFYGFEVLTDDRNYYSNTTSTLPNINAGSKTFTGDGTKTLFSSTITFSNPHNTTPIITCGTNSKDYTVGFINITTTGFDMYVSKKDGTAPASGVNIIVMWQSIETTQ